MKLRYRDTDITVYDTKVAAGQKTAGYGGN